MKSLWRFFGAPTCVGELRFCWPASIGMVPRKGGTGKFSKKTWGFGAGQPTPPEMAGVPYHQGLMKTIGFP